MHGLTHDCLLALRGFARRPGVVIVAVVSLALGIGANAAVVSVVDALLFRPLALERAEELIALLSEKEGERDDCCVSWPDYRDFREMPAVGDVFAGLAASSDYTFSLRVGEATERVHGELVSWDYFDVLGAAPDSGRGFLPEEEEAPSPVVVVSARLARLRFPEGEDPVGRTIRVNGHPLTVIGIAPEGFRGTRIATEVDLWAPLSLVSTLWPRTMEFFARRDVPGVRVVARLAPGVGLENARAAMALAARDLEREHPETNGGATVAAVPFRETRLGDAEAVRSYLGVLVAVAALLLLIGASNVAGLRLVDLSGREEELSVRRALGASGARIARQFLVENALLYGVAFSLSLGVAHLFLLYLEKLRLFQMSLAEVGLELDGRVLLVAGLVTLASAVAFGVAPALLARVSVLPGRATISERRGATRVQAGFVVLQVALSSALLFGTGLLLRTLQSVYAVDPGFRMENVLFASVDLQSIELRYDEARAKAFYRDVLERVEGLPGVRSAAWSADIPFERMTIRTLFVLEEEVRGEGEPDWRDADADIVTPGYLRTMGVDLLRGRDFTADDDESSAGVAIVNEAMAGTYWPNDDPIGQRLRVFGRQGIHHDYYEIVGVVSNAKYRTLWEEPRPYIYFPLAQRFFQYMNLHVHTTRPPLAALPAVREIVRSLDSDLPLYDARPLSEERDILLARQRSMGTLFGVSGALAWLLTAIGTYAVAAQVVARRGREVGLRMALGADRSRIVRWVMGRGMAPVVVGIALGALLAAGVARAMAQLLIGVGAVDGYAAAATVFVLAATGGLASYAVARRAARLTPAEALRTE